MRGRPGQCSCGTLNPRTHSMSRSPWGTEQGQGPQRADSVTPGLSHRKTVRSPTRELWNRVPPAQRQGPSLRQQPPLPPHPVFGPLQIPFGERNLSSGPLPSRTLDKALPLGLGFSIWTTKCLSFLSSAEAFPPHSALSLHAPGHIRAMSPAWSCPCSNRSLSPSAGREVLLPGAHPAGWERCPPVGAG